MSKSPGGTHAKDAPRTRTGRPLLWVGLAVAVVLTIAVVASMFIGRGNAGHGAELRPTVLRDQLPAQMADSWTEERCFLFMDHPKGLGEAPDDVPADVPAVNCLLLDGSANGISTTMVGDEDFASAVTDPADGVDMTYLGASDDGRHEVSWLAGTGLIYDVTDDAVLRFGPYSDENAAREFAVSHGLLSAE